MGELFLSGRRRGGRARLPGHQRRRSSSPTGQALYTVRLQRARHDPRRPDRLPPAPTTRLLIVCNAEQPRQDQRALRARAARDHCEFEDAPTTRADRAAGAARAQAILRALGAARASPSCRASASARRSVADVAADRRAHRLHRRGRRRALLRDGATRRALGRAARAGRRRSASRRSASARATRCASRRGCCSTATTSTRRPTRSRPGLGWVVKLDKGEFIGRAALAARQEQRRARASSSASR